MLLFGSTAKEFVHLFAGHEDTTHCNHAGSELVFENEHHHCDFLSFSLPLFLSTPVCVLEVYTPASYHSFSTVLCEPEFRTPCLLPAFRGPPAVVL